MIEYDKGIRVASLNSPFSGRPVENQVEVEAGGLDYFFSYGTLVAVRQGGEIVLDETYWHCSVTTLKYLKVWLGFSGITKKDIKDGIKSGRFQTARLNER